MASRSDIEHLLRRTEFVARRSRVDALLPLSRAAAVDNILAVPADPGSVSFTSSENWERGVELTHYWLDRMAHDSPRPLQEKMAFFWHGHFCSDLSKVGSAALMRQQINLFRRRGLGNVRTLARIMSTQVAMLRYLDNNQNKQSSPNQNFARELMELFLLGVGNYTEADVEAATSAWTGHGDQWDTGEYVWRPEWHDGSRKRFLRRWINDGGDPKLHGKETIDVILGNGIVPDGATVASNRGRPTREVAAEFLSKKLWIEFAGTEPSKAVIGALRDAALANDFAITPWLRTLLMRDEFYSTEVKRGLVRSPVEFMVAGLVATGRRSVDGTPIWLMDGMGQRPLYPPNVSGWRHNGYWVNASAMAKRTDTARQLVWRSMSGYWDGDGRIHLGRGSITRTEVEADTPGAPKAVLDRLLDLMDLSLRSSTYDALLTYARRAQRWERSDLVMLILLAPDFHTA